MAMADDGMRPRHAERVSDRAVQRDPDAAAGTPPDPRRPDTPWRAGIATGVGSLPGTDPMESAALIAGELPDLPHLVELPQRGAGADMIGRTAAMLIDMPAEVVPSGWRLTRRPGRDVRRAADFLAWDTDAAERHFAGAAWIKIQAVGPWTLAAQLETPSGNRALLDSGAVADLAASFIEGVAAQRSELARRLPGTGVVIQIDEPSLPAVLAGTLATASGFGTVPAVDESRAVELLADLVQGLAGGARADGGDHAASPVAVHCCHPAAPVDLLRRAGFRALSLDLTGVGSSAARLDPLAEAVEDGVVLLAGLIPTTDPSASNHLSAAGGDPASNGDPSPDDTSVPRGRFDFRQAAGPLLDLWHRVGLPDARFSQVLVTPTCGLGTASPAWARRSLALARDAGRLLHERAEQA